METYIPLIRKLVVIAIWVYVGMEMIPAARKGDRSALVWYFFGLFAFYIPFSIIAILPQLLMLIAMAKGFDLSGVFDTVGFMAFCAGLYVGFACLQRVKAMATVLRQY